MRKIFKIFNFDCINIECNETLEQIINFKANKKLLSIINQGKGFNKTIYINNKYFFGDKSKYPKITLSYLKNSRDIVSKKNAFTSIFSKQMYIGIIFTSQTFIEEILNKNSLLYPTIFSYDSYYKFKEKMFFLQKEILDEDYYLPLSKSEFKSVNNKLFNHKTFNIIIGDPLKMNNFPDSLIRAIKELNKEKYNIRLYLLHKNICNNKYLTKDQYQIITSCRFANTIEIEDRYKLNIFKMSDMLAYTCKDFSNVIDSSLLINEYLNCDKPILCSRGKEKERILGNNYKGFYDCETCYSVPPIYLTKGYLLEPTNYEFIYKKYFKNVDITNEVNQIKQIIKKEYDNCIRIKEESKKAELITEKKEKEAEKEKERIRQHKIEIEEKRIKEEKERIEENKRLKKLLKEQEIKFKEELLNKENNLIRYKKELDQENYRKLILIKKQKEKEEQRLIDKARIQEEQLKKQKQQEEKRLLEEEQRLIDKARIQEEQLKKQKLEEEQLLIDKARIQEEQLKKQKQEQEKRVLEKEQQLINRARIQEEQLRQQNINEDILKKKELELQNKIDNNNLQFEKLRKIEYFQENKFKDIKDREELIDLYITEKNISYWKNKTLERINSYYNEDKNKQINKDIFDYRNLNIVINTQSDLNKIAGDTIMILNLIKILKNDNKILIVTPFKPTILFNNLDNKKNIKIIVTDSFINVIEQVHMINDIIFVRNSNAIKNLKNKSYLNKTILYALDNDIENLKNLNNNFFRVITQSNKLKELFIKNNIDKDKIIIKEPIVYDYNFDLPVRSDNQIKLIYCGTLRNEENILEIIEKFKLIHQENNNVVLKIIFGKIFGDKEYISKMRKLVNLNIDGITFKEKLKHKDACYEMATSDIGIIWRKPGWGENGEISTKLKEYQHYNLFILNNDIINNEEYNIKIQNKYPHNIYKIVTFLNLLRKNVYVSI